MDEDKFAQAFIQWKKKYLNDQIAFSQAKPQQLALGATTTSSTSNGNTIAKTVAANLYATAGATSAKQYYNKEVYNASLFIDDKLKILAANPYATLANNMYKIEDTSYIPPGNTITEYFNIVYYDNLITPGSKCKYAINDTKNVIKHLNYSTQTFENIAKHASAFQIGRIAHKWEDLHEALT